MHLELALDIWTELKQYMASDSDKSLAAESLVQLLVDNDYSPSEISNIFKSDSDIKSALAAFSIDEYESEYYADEDDYDDTIDDDEDDDY